MEELKTWKIKTWRGDMYVLYHYHEHYKDDEEDGWYPAFYAGHLFRSSCTCGVAIPQAMKDACSFVGRNYY